MLALASCIKPTSTIDPDLQSNVDSILQLKMSEINAISGQAIVMDMAGNIKAMVGNGKKQPSALMRVVSINNALDTKKISLSDIVDTGNGVVIFNGDTIFDHNWHRGGYGKISLKKGSVPESIIAFLESTDFESAVRLAVSLGGDADTMGAITGGIAEAFYGGVPEHIRKEVLKRMPNEFIEVMQKFYQKFVEK